jgi:hypothetical membrane protein
VVGPVVFIAGWSVLGAIKEGYDPTRTAISRLAAVGASTRPAMTAGLLVLSGGMALYAAALRPRPAWTFAAANGLTTLLVAAFPLGSRYDTAHGICAAASYVTLAAIPVAAAPGSRGRTRRWAAVAVGALSGACLLATVVVDRDGLLQRAGLTVAQLWVMHNALGLARSPSPRAGANPPSP